MLYLMTAGPMETIAAAGIKKAVHLPFFKRQAMLVVPTIDSLCLQDWVVLALTS